MSDELTVGSLFSGIGGIDLGLEWAGMRTRWFVEYDPHCQNVLRRHWPGVPIYGDIHAVDWSELERVDVLAGGFPCQPISAAGLQAAQEDARWLWPQFARAIRELRPRYVLVENVTNLLAINDGSAFGDVLGDLAESGYDAEWDCIPACAVGALHERDRVWIVAYPQGDGRSRGRSGDERRDADPQSEQRLRAEPAGDGGHGALAYAIGSGAQPERVAGDVSGAAGGTESPSPQRQRGGDAARDSGQALAHAEGERRERSGDARRGRDGPANGGEPLAHAASVGSGAQRATVGESQRADGIGGSGQSVPDADRGDAQGIKPQRHDAADRRESTQRPSGLFGGARPSGRWPAEPAVGRVANGVPHRVDRLRSLGNAVVPQVVEWIGRRIVAFDEGVEN